MDNLILWALIVLGIFNTISLYESEKLLSDCNTAERVPSGSIINLSPILTTPISSVVAIIR